MIAALCSTFKTRKLCLSKTSAAIPIPRGCVSNHGKKKHVWSRDLLALESVCRLAKPARSWIQKSLRGERTRMSIIERLLRIGTISRMFLCICETIDARYPASPDDYSAVLTIHTLLFFFHRGLVIFFFETGGRHFSNALRMSF